VIGDDVIVADRITVGILFCASQLLSKWWSHSNAQ